MRRRLALTALAALAAGCVPGRDNPNDTANAPIARLRIVDPVTGTEAISAPRSHPIVLDASESTDPQQPASELEYTYFWAVSSTGQFAVIATASSALTLSETFRYELAPVDTLLRFRVTVRDADGGHSTSESETFEIHNAPPVAIVDAPRTFPADGVPANPGEPFEIVFHGDASFDPDEEAAGRLSYEWAVEGGTPVGVLDSSAVTVLVEPGEKRVTATLRLGDGLSHSTVARGVATLRPENVWLNAINNGAILAFDPLSRSVFSNGQPQSIAIVNGDDGELHMALYERSSGNVRYGAWPNFPSTTRSGVLAASGDAVVVLAEDDQPLVWTVAADASAGTLTAQPWNAGSSLTSLAAAAVGSGVPTTSNTIEAVLANDGALWAASSYGESLFAFEPGVVASTITDPGQMFVSLAARPGDSGEVWALRGTEADEYSLLRIAPAGVLQEFPLDGSFASGIAFADERELWLALPGIGMDRIDIDLLEVAANWRDAIVFALPGAPVAHDLTLDPKTGSLWFPHGASASSVRVDLDGGVTHFSPLSEVQTVDPVGGVWWQGTDSSIRGALAPDESHAIAHGTFPGAILDVSRMGGEAWIGTAQPNALGLMAEDGTTLRFDTEAVVDGVTREIPSLYPLVLDQGVEPRGWAYALAEDGSRSLVRVELPHGELPALMTILDSQEIATYAITDLALLEPGLGGAFAWIRTGATLSTIAETPGAVPATVLTIPGTELDFTAAASLHTGNVCAASRSSTGFQITARALSPSGVLQTRSASPGTASDIAAVAVSRGLLPGDPDICWVATTPSGGCGNGASHVYSWTLDAAMSPLQSLDLTNRYILSAVMPDAETVWMTGWTCPSGTDIHSATRMQLDGSLTTEELELPEGLNFYVLSNPEHTSP